MRLRLPELLAEHKPPLTAYAVAKASRGRIALTTIYRLNRNRGRVTNFDGELLEASVMCLTSSRGACWSAKGIVGNCAEGKGHDDTRVRRLGASEGDR